MPKSSSLLKAALVAIFITPFPDLSLGAGSVKGQMPPAPKVDWTAINWEDERSPAGTYYQLNTGTGLWEVDPV